MFDGLRAAKNRAPHAFGRDCMHRHWNACALGGLNRELHFFHSECRVRSRRWTPAVIAVQLDPIRPVADLIANHPYEAVDTIGLLGALRHFPFERKSLRSVASSSDDGPR